MPDNVQNSVMEQLFLALHHLSALEAAESANSPADFSRIAVLAWYYGIYNAASAMIAAKNGSSQETHAGTAKMWDTEFAATGLAMEPFERRVSSLEAKVYKPEIAAYKVGNAGDLQSQPTSIAEARGAVISYLSGTADWYASYETDKVRDFSAYKKLGKSDFRTKAARKIRDAHLAKKAVGFVHEAYRYRGKANYREALFLGYGKNTGAQLTNFVSDQVVVLRGFLAMAGAFASRKLGAQLWTDFVADVDANKAFSTTAAGTWS